MSATPRTSGEPLRERRRCVRAPVVDAQFIPIVLEKQTGGLILDLSEDGFALQSIAGLPSGETRDFDFQLPDSATPLRGRGEVRWSEKSGRSGIRFVDFSLGSAADVKAWVANALNPSSAVSLETLNATRLQRELAKSGLDVDGTLEVIVERTREATRATGVAIAIGTGDEMTCRASVGAAPAVGTQLQAKSGLSGQCVRNKATVRCEDTENDSRVDAEVCRQLDLRSAVLVPVLADGDLRGVLEAFSNRPRAFRSSDIQLLQQIAELISATVSERHPQPSRPARIPAVPIPSSTAAATSVSSMKFERSHPELPVIVPTPAPTELSPRPAVEEEMLSSLRTGFVPPTVEKRILSPVVLSRVIKSGIAVVAVFLVVIASWEAYRHKIFPFDTDTTSETSSEAPVPTSSSDVQPAPKKQDVRKARKSAVPAKPKEMHLTVSSASTPTPNFGLNILSDRPAERKTPSDSAIVPPTGVTSPTFLYGVAPVKANVGGEVVLNAIVRKDGTVGTIEVVSGDPNLARAAVEALRNSRFAPSKQGGLTIEAPIVIRLTFDPHH